jgi:hypothetical protein
MALIGVGSIQRSAAPTERRTTNTPESRLSVRKAGFLQDGPIIPLVDGRIG